MSLSEHQLVVIRSWVGVDPDETDQVLSDNYDRLDSFDAVIEEILYSRISELAAQPASFSVPGLSISNGINITTWENILDRFKMTGSGLDTAEYALYGSGIRTSVIVRPDYR